MMTSEFILKEFTAKLIQKFKIARADTRAARMLLESRMQIVEPTALPEPKCRDSDDDWVLATAVTGACHCIVTGDGDLLALHEYAGIRIVQPAAFWRYELSSGHAG